MCADPVLLCLDEPAAGLNPQEDRELSDLLMDIKRELGMAILLIEHDMSVVMRISDHIVVLDHGACIADGTPAEVRSNPDVIKAYLGEEDLSEVSASTGGALPPPAGGRGGMLPPKSREAGQGGEPTL
jgi:branched-chain amino acid transport system ATP-binding protein